MFCKKCSKKILDNSIFCNFCGAKQSNTSRSVKQRGNGQGSVYKSGNKWRIEIVLGFSVTETGKKKRKTFTKSGFNTKKEALDFIANFKGDTAGSAIKDLWQLFYDGDLQKLSEKRQAAYELSYRRISILHNKNIADIAFPTLQNIINKYSFYNARYIKDLLSKLYQIAIPQGYVTNNLSLYLSLPAKENVKETLAFSQDDIQKMWNAYNSGDDYAHYLLIMIYTGMMTSEILSLTPSMINLDKNIIVGANSSKTQARKNLPIVFPNTIKPVLAHIVATYPADTKIFDKSSVTFNRYFKDFQSKYNITAGTSPYSARRTTATILALKNVSPALIAKIMRQTNYQTTLQYYTKINVDDELRALNDL